MKREWWSAAFCLFLFIGVSAAEPLPGITGDEDRESESAPSEAAAPLAPTAQAQAYTEEQAKERLQTPVSLSFTNADLRNVLSGLAKTYGLNIVVDETVKGTVNISLRGVTLEEALKQILKLNGYTFVWEGSILRVASMEEEVVTEVLSLNFLQADVALEFLKNSASDSGVMKADEVQGGILVTDTASRLEAMKTVLKQIDLPPQQVLIQARLLDITHTDQDNLGLKLSSISFDIPLRASLTQPLLNIASGALDVSGPSSELTTDTITATISRGSETVTATIDALIRNKRVKVLASPTVSTLNNVEAKITIGEKFPISETTQTTTGTLQTTRFVDIGITLRVTPKISKSGFIQMQIHPEVSSVSSTIDAGPRITTREADTTIIIKNRESVVIAGLIKEEETQTRDRIPILGHVPLIGLLFQNRAKSYEQKELVIVITPFLLPVETAQTTPGSEVQEAHERLTGTELFRQAYDFELGKTYQSRDLPLGVRLLRSVELYETMADRFPGHTLTPESLWRAGQISWDKLHNSSRALAALNQLTKDYPDHPLAVQARKRIQEVQNYLERKRRRTAKQEREDSKEEESEPAAGPAVNYGFR